MQAIDLTTLRRMLETAERMIPYYAEKLAERQAQNAAMQTAGLKPMHDTFALSYDRQYLTEARAEAEILRKVIAVLEHPVSAQTLADHAQSAFDDACPDEPSGYDIGQAWKAVGEHLAALTAEHVEEVAAEAVAPVAQAEAA